jgi:hypothetical protein
LIEPDIEIEEISIDAIKELDLRVYLKKCYPNLTEKELGEAVEEMWKLDVVKQTLSFEERMEDY